MNKNLLFYIIVLFFVNSCSLDNNINIFSKKKPILLNFENTIDNIIVQMIHNKHIIFSKQKSLYVHLLNNKSNALLDNIKLTNTIIEKIVNHTKKINIIDNNTLNNTKKKFGLLSNDVILDTRTAMFLARTNNITYYLESNICKTDDKELLLLKMQLILVKTGEIIFYTSQNFHF